MLHDRTNGRGASVTYWASEDAMRGSEAAASATRAQATQAGGSVVDLERFEIVVQERTAPPKAQTFVRTNDLRGSVDKLDDLIALVRDKLYPVLRSQKGFRALLMRVNRHNGRSFVTSVWETAADREASDAAVRDLRREGGQAAGAQPSVEEYEVAFTEMSQAATSA